MGVASGKVDEGQANAGFYYIWLMTVMAQCRLAGGRGKQSKRSKQRLGVASLYKIMCFALCAAINFYGTSVWRMWLL